MKTLFHLALPEHDLEAAREFYGVLLGCRETVQAHQRVDFDFFGHQICLHPGVSPALQAQGGPHLAVDERGQPLPQLGIWLSLPQWRALAQRIMAAGQPFVVPPHCRHQGGADEHWTLVVRDPLGNLLEILGGAEERRGAALPPQGRDGAPGAGLHC